MSRRKKREAERKAAEDRLAEKKAERKITRAEVLVEAFDSWGNDNHCAIAGLVGVYKQVLVDEAPWSRSLRIYSGDRKILVIKQEQRAVMTWVGTYYSWTLPLTKKYDAAYSDVLDEFISGLIKKTKDRDEKRRIEAEREEAERKAKLNFERTRF